MERRYKSGLWRSLNPAHYNIEKWLYVLHRITGFIILLYLIAHVFEIYHITLGQEGWNATMSELSSLGIWEKIGLWIVAGSVLFHGANGLRLILSEMFAVLLGRPSHPVYPYKPQSLGKSQKAAVYTIIAIVIALWIWAGLYLLADLGIIG